jgi:hypothetical protein
MGRGLGVGVGRGVAVGGAVGVEVGVADAVAGSLSKKTFSWDCPLIATRPSTQEVMCFVLIAEP